MECRLGNKTRQIRIRILETHFTFQIEQQLCSLNELTNEYTYVSLHACNYCSNYEYGISYNKSHWNNYNWNFSIILKHSFYSGECYAVLWIIYFHIFQIKILFVRHKIPEWENHKSIFSIQYDNMNLLYNDSLSPSPPLFVLTTYMQLQLQLFHKRKLCIWTWNY